MSVTAQNVSGKYTEEILNRNFTAIAKSFSSIDGRLDMFDDWIRHLEGHVGELYKAAQTATKPKGVKTKYKVVLGVAAGIYIGKKVMTREFNEKLERVRREAKEQYDNFVAEQKSPDRSDVIG
jgi:hypothetical protein